MAEKHPKSSHDPTAKSLGRWENEGGAPKRPKRPRDPNALAKTIVDIATGDVAENKNYKNEKAASLGHKGGLTRAQKLSSEKRKQIAKKKPIRDGRKKVSSSFA